MKLRLLLTLSSLSLLFFISCKNKGGSTGLMVPKDAALVFHISGGSLTSKLSWDEIKQTEWFKDASKNETDEFSKQLLADPGKSGIDLKGDFVFYMKKQGRGGYMIFEGPLKDAAAYEKLINEMDKDNPKEIKKDGEFSYINTNDRSILLWNKSNFAIVGNAPFPDQDLFKSRRSYRDFRFSDDSLRNYGKEALKLKNSDNLDADKRFADLIKDGSDMHFWVSASEFYGGIGSLVSMLKVSALIEDNIMAASINFDNGKITANSKQYCSEEMRKLLDKYKPEPISADVINRIPSNHVAGVLAFNYPPGGLIALLKLIGADGVVNDYLGRMNYSVEEFAKAIKGEVLLSVSDVALVKRYDTINYGNGMAPYIYSKTKPDLKVLLATSIKDKTAFEKLVGLVSESADEWKHSMPEVTTKMNNDWFAASNSPEQAENFIAGVNSKQAFASKIAGHPFGFYLDLQELIRNLGASADKSDDKEAMDASLKMWQDIVVTGGDYKDKAIHTTGEINLVDKNTNSLKQLNQYIDKVFTIKKASRGMQDMRLPVPDSVAAPKKIK